MRSRAGAAGTRRCYTATGLLGDIAIGDHRAVLELARYPTKGSPRQASLGYTTSDGDGDGGFNMRSAQFSLSPCASIAAMSSCHVQLPCFGDDVCLCITHLARVAPATPFLPREAKREGDTSGSPDDTKTPLSPV